MSASYGKGPNSSIAPTRDSFLDQLQQTGVRVYAPGGPVGVDPDNPSIHLTATELRRFGIRPDDPLHQISIAVYGPGDEGIVERRWMEDVNKVRTAQLNELRAAGFKVDPTVAFADEVPL